MTIGTSLFHTINARSLTRASGEISDLQERISSGKNDPLSSADPIRAMRLSASAEQQNALDRFSTNLERAQTRLDQADGILGEISTVLRRVGELAVRLASDSVTPSERDTVTIELRELRAGVLAMANSRDDTGRPLFGGYMVEGDPFVDGPTGIAYHGDGGQTRLQVSETASVATGLSGDHVFGSVSGTGANVFRLLDDFLTSVQSAGQDWTDQASASHSLTVTPQASRAPVAWSMTLSGPDGTASLAFDLAASAPYAARDAINAATAQTGVQATLDAQGALVLSASGSIALSNLATQPALSGVLATTTTADGASVRLVAPHATPDAQISRLRAASNHIADRRAELGSLSANAQTRGDIIENRRVILQKAVAGLEDLDLAAALTKLQKLMVNRDATQQAYVKIIQKSLFDYIR